MTELRQQPSVSTDEEMFLRDTWGLSDQKYFTPGGALQCVAQ